MSEPGHIETITVTASADPALFSNFANMAAVFDFFGGSQGGQPSEEDYPVEEGGLIIEVDPDTETLISSSEFQRLNQILKAEIFKDPQLMAAFASFISQGGFFYCNKCLICTFSSRPAAAH
ncbi:hypothetical protein [Solilutibacter tolerans]|uniref:hypothetical protein n=1 Tax=Solilutibacter tolerans TaxID=1604334 RepID=UPI00101AD162|nr:hypothetical protein [Lysobacter tolerans]